MIASPAHMCDMGLMLVGSATDASGGFTSGTERREQNGDQQDNDRHDDQEFNDRKTSPDSLVNWLTG
jgi:hypothetical protein